VQRIAAVVRTESGLDALLSPPDLLEPTGARRWALPTDLGPELHAVRAGDKVVITSYDRDAPGATLAALDAKTGASAWRGDVELRVTGKRPRYFTTVRLSVDGDAVVLEGSETSQQYLQIFSLADGKRLVSVVRGR
jgi:outer membrane protein assembly factor BamB